MGPRGIGTMASMIIVGRLSRKVDQRVLVVTGILLTAASLHLMTRFSPQMTASPVIWSGVLQGMGMGLVFVPLATVAFATIDAKYRADATALFSLIRNIGSAIGISVVSVELARNVQINHAELGAAISPYNPVLTRMVPGVVRGDPAMLQLLDGLVNLQGLMISYLDDFKLMMLVTLAALPLVLLLGRSDKAPVAGARSLAHSE